MNSFELAKEASNATLYSGDILSQILTPEMVSVMGVAGTVLLVLVLGFLVAFLLMIRKSFKASHESQRVMAETNKENSVNMQRFFDGFVDLVNTQNASVTMLLDDIRKAVGKESIGLSLLKDIFDQVSFNHVNMKGAYIERILVKNNIKDRKEQIKRNIDSKFREITQKEIALFNQINSKDFGDFGKVFSCWVDKVWSGFIENVYSIVFSDDEINQKLSDLKGLMQGALSDFWDEITNK